MFRSKANRSKPTYVFFILLGYVMAQFAWWTYLIYDLNKQIYAQQEVIEQLEQEKFDGALTNRTVLQEQLEHKVLMIAGEGTVFLLLLLGGAFYVLRSFKREQALALQQSNFLLSITHELNSPLASIRLYLQTLSMRKLGEEKRESVVNHALSETDRLSALVDNLLLATRIENNKSPFYREQDDLSQLVQSFSEKPFFQNLQSHTLQWDIAPNIHFAYDPLGITSLLTNLVENAIKYSPEGTNITVRLTQERGAIQLSVADQGRGITDEEKEKIFDKFYREGREETRKTKGTGLGLYIVRTVVEAHNGRVKVLDNKPEGAIFAVHFQTT